MFYDALSAAIAGARTMAQTNALNSQLNAALYTGAIDEAAAVRLGGLIELRRDMLREARVPVGIPAGRPSLFPPRRPCSSPDRLASRERNRRLAYSGPLPPSLAERYAVGEIAILRIIGDEWAEKGICGLHVEAIAARAGVSRRHVQKTIRAAALDGLITIQERPREGRKNDTNLIRIISAEWRQWLKRGPRRKSASRMPDPIGRTENRPTDTGVKSGDRRGVKVSGVATPRSHRVAPAADAPGGSAVPESKTAVQLDPRKAAEGQRLFSSRSS